MRYPPRPHKKRNVAAKVVIKMVGRTTRRATPTMKSVKRTAASRPMRSAAIREKTKTVMEKVMNRMRGTPVRMI